jgi:hypothetical protein
MPRREPQGVLQYQIGRGCVLQLKKYDGIDAYCIKPGKPGGTCQNGCKLDPPEGPRQGGHNHPATVVDINEISRAGTTEISLTFIVVSCYFLLRKLSHANLVWKMTSHPVPRLGRSLPVANYSFVSDGGMTKYTVFFLGHIYTLPLSSFLHFHGAHDDIRRGTRAAYDHRFDEKSFRDLLEALKWPQLLSQVYERHADLRQNPAEQPLTNTSPPTGHAELSSLDSRILENQLQSQPPTSLIQQANDDQTTIAVAGIPADGPAQRPIPETILREAEAETVIIEAAVPVPESVQPLPHDTAHQVQQVNIAALRGEFKFHSFCNCNSLTYRSSWVMEARKAFLARCR